MSKRRVVTFTWLDAVASHGWEPGLNEQAEKCVAAGVLIAETPREITLAVTASKDSEGKVISNARLTIPKGWIEGKVTTLGWIEDNKFLRATRKRG